MSEEISRPLSRNIRIVTLAMGVLLLIMGVTKLAGLELQREFFRALDLPAWSLPLAGVAEIVIALITLNRPTHAYGVALVLVWLVFATLTHVMRGAQLYWVFLDAILIFLAIGVLKYDRPPFLRVTERPQH